MQNTYQSKYPVTAKVSKKPESEWEVKNGHCEIMIDGGRLSFANLWKPGTYNERAKKANDADIIIPLTEANAEAIKLINACYAHAAGCCTPPATPKSIAKKQRKLIEVPLGTKKLDDDGDEVMKDGVAQLVANDGHLIVRTYNTFDRPITYVTGAGKSVVPVKKNSPDNDYDIFEKVMDPSGVEAQELVGTGNNVRVKISMTQGRDFDGNPKVWVSLIAVQFLAEDEKLSKGGARGADTSDFGTVAPPAGDGFETADQVPALADDPFGAPDTAADPFA